MHIPTKLLYALPAVGLLAVGSVSAGNPDRITGTVVGMDTSLHTVTLKSDKGVTATTPVEGAALDELGQLKVGETVGVTYRDNANGNREAVTDLVVYRTVKVFQGQ
jgi:hypothetical protein